MNWCWYNPVFTSLTPLLQMKYVCFLSPFLLGDFFKKTLLITNFFQKQLHWSIKGNKLYKISCPPFRLVTFLHLLPDYWVLLSPLIVPVVWAFLFLCFFLPFVCLFCLFVFWKNTSCWQLWQEPPLWVPGGLNLPLYLSLPVSFPSDFTLNLNLGVLGWMPSYSRCVTGLCRKGHCFLFHQLRHLHTFALSNLHRPSLLWPGWRGLLWCWRQQEEAAAGSLCLCSLPFQ